MVEVIGTGESFVVPPDHIDDRARGEGLPGPDVTSETYKTYATPGGPTVPGYGFHPGGTSVQRVLSYVLGARSTLVQSAVVISPAGSRDELRNADEVVAAPGAYEVPGETPMFFVESNTQVSYNRPLRNENDTNVVPNGYTSISSPIIVQVSLTPGTTVVRPVIEATPTRTKVGSDVGFSVRSFAGAQPHEALRYVWSFGDGRTSTVTDCDPSTTSGCGKTTHTYTHASGVTGYQVDLTVKGATTSGAASPVFVKVDGPAPPPPTHKGPPGNGDDTNGLTNAAGDKSGHRTIGTQDATSGSGGNGSATRDGKSGKQQKQQQASNGNKDADRTSPGESVAGVLLDADAARSVTIRAPEAAPVAAAAARRGSTIPTDWRWLLGLVPLALLLGGVARQTPWLAGRLPRPPWREV